MKLVSWSRLVSVNRSSINNHTKIVHWLLSTSTATLNRHHSCYLWWAPDASWSPRDEIGETIPTQSSQHKGYTPLHMYSYNPFAHHCLSVSSGVFNWWKSMIGKPINQSIPIDWSSIININQLIDIDCHRLSISSIGYPGYSAWSCVHSERSFCHDCLHILCFYYINTIEIPGEILRENMISSHVKRSPLLWLHNKLLLLQEKAIKVLFTVCCNGVWLPSWIT